MYLKEGFTDRTGRIPSATDEAITLVADRGWVTQDGVSIGAGIRRLRCGIRRPLLLDALRLPLLRCLRRLSSLGVFRRHNPVGMDNLAGQAESSRILHGQLQAPGFPSFPAPHAQPAPRTGARIDRVQTRHADTSDGRWHAGCAAVSSSGLAEIRGLLGSGSGCLADHLDFRLIRRSTNRWWGARESTKATWSHTSCTRDGIAEVWRQASGPAKQSMSACGLPRPQAQARQAGRRSALAERSILTTASGPRTEWRDRRKKAGAAVMIQRWRALRHCRCSTGR